MIPEIPQQGRHHEVMPGQSVSLTCRPLESHYYPENVRVGFKIYCNQIIYQWEYSMGPMISQSSHFIH